MTRKVLFIVIIFLILFNTKVFTESYQREKDIYEEKFLLGARGGMFFGDEIYSFHSDIYILNFPAWFENNTKMKDSGAFGGTVGYFFTDNLGFRFDIDIISTDLESEFRASIPYNIIPGFSGEVSTTVDGLTGNWTVISLDLVYRQKISSRLVFQLGAGGTAWFTNIYMIDNFTWEWVGTSLTLLQIDYEVYPLDAFSFNILAILEYYVDDDIGLSIEGRYLHANADLDVPDYISAEPLPVEIGGFYFAAGLNLHF